MDNKVKLLIVDDLEDNRLVLMGACRKLAGVEILEATNGQEAVDICDRIKPQIILMDLMMPVMDGAEATGIIKNRYPDTIIIIITAVVDSSTEEKMIKAGATAYITKPINREMLFFKVQNYINIVSAKEGSCKLLPGKKAINPFSKEIRSFKTIFNIDTPNDMMDLGMWLLGWCTSRSETLTYLFDSFVSFIYINLNKSIKKSESITIVIEESFDDLYMSVIFDRAAELIKTSNNCISMMSENIIVAGNTIYIHLNLSMLKECIQAKAAHEEYIPTPLSEDVKQTYKPTSQIRGVSDEEKDLIRKSFELKTSAKEYIADIGGDVYEEIKELESADSDWEHNTEQIKMSPTKEALEHFANTSLSQYIHALNRLFEFSSLARALVALQTFIKNESEVIVKQEKCDQLADLLLHLGQDIASWRMHVFILQDTADIHYLDSSFFSSCMQIEGVVSNKSVETDDNELELF